MSKFKSMNYTRVVCEECGSETIIEPGIVFEGLNCNCKVEESKAYKNITVFTDGENYVERLGVFKNGDLEVKHVDGTLSYRVPAGTFATQYNEVQEDETAETPATNKEENSISEGSTIVILSLDDLKGKTVEETKEAYNMDELRVLAKASKIRGASQMNGDKLVGKLLAKAE